MINPLEKIHNPYPKIFELHKNYLKNLNCINPQLNILFSGVPSSGKTTLAKLLTRRYNGICFEGEVIRKISFDYGFARTNEEAEKIKDNYLYWFIRNRSFDNKLFILDRSIDRIYPWLLALLNEKEEDSFIISLKISPKSAREEFRKRRFSSEENRTMYLHRWFKENNNAGEYIRPNITMSRPIELEPLYVLLDNFLK